jgi:formate-dependent nitrite reductase membrane component NrfD
MDIAETGNAIMHEVELNRHSHLIDPALRIWGWEIPLYLFLGGLVAGLMFFSAILARREDIDSRSKWSRWLPFLAPVILSIGMLALLMDLEYKWHVLRFYAAFKPASPMSWGSWILLLIYPATLAMGLMGLTRDEVRQISSWRWIRTLRANHLLLSVHDFVRRQLPLVLWSNLVLGIALGVYTGILLGAVGARAAWNTAVLAPLFLVSGISTGAALMMLFPLNRDEHRLLQRWDIGAIVVELAVLGMFFLALLANGGEAGHQAAKLMLGGPYTAVFWGVVVIAGLVAPLVLELIELRMHRRPVWITPVLILIAGLALRWVIVFAGQA